jgi:hypothetical protein
MTNSIQFILVEGPSWSWSNGMYSVLTIVSSSLARGKMYSIQHNVIDESISLSHHWCEHEMYISKNIHNYLMLLFNATFNNISVISWRSVLLAEETVEPEENYLPQTDKLYHIMLYRVHFATSETRTHNCKHWVHKGNNKITELWTILQRESQTP